MQAPAVLQSPGLSPTMENDNGPKMTRAVRTRRERKALWTGAETVPACFSGKFPSHIPLPHLLPILGRPGKLPELLGTGGSREIIKRPPI